ncbi:MAG TPA: D-Ala-D-Ala carboxypeptidase family metallohydrolase [Gemmatimonadales bacterium]|jgi:hypothetical protein
MRMMVRRLVAFAAVTTQAVAAVVGVLAMTAPSRVLPARSLADSNAVDVTPLLGLSGQLRAVAYPDDGPPAVPLAALIPALAERGPGVHPTGLEAPDGAPIQALALIPLKLKLGAIWRGYRVGFWPGERAPERGRARYRLPNGFLEVTPENQELRLSTHFRVGDFLTHDQQDRWPKVLVIQLPLLDKLELITTELRALGRPSALRVMSGFRTPQYNALGVGRLGGRARDSRHMYGDAADVYVDSDADGRMDDLDGDGRVTVSDARWLAGVAAQVEAQYPEVAGGIGIYRANGLHGPFVHVDTRGTPARW